MKKTTSPFGVDDTPERSGPHKGMDFPADPGDPVFSYTSGRVIKVVHDDPSFGNYVVVKGNDGVLTTYAHLNSTDTTVGKTVGITTPLGIAGNTGLTNGGIHVHVETSTGGKIVDPSTVIPQLSGGRSATVSGTGGPPSQDDEDDTTRDWFSELSASLGSLVGTKPGSPLLPTMEGPGLESSGLFNRPPATGSGTDIFNNAPSFQGGVGTREGRQLLPLHDRSLGGRSAFAENIIRGLGFAPGRGNPFVDQMQGEAERLSTPAFFARLMRGESVDERAIADDVVNMIRSGQRRPMEMDAMREAFAKLPGDNEAMTPQQELLAGILRDRPGMIADLVTATTDLPPDLAGLMPGILERRRRSAIRSSADVPQASLADFLLRQ